MKCPPTAPCFLFWFQTAVKEKLEKEFVYFIIKASQFVIHPAIKWTPINKIKTYCVLLQFF